MALELAGIAKSFGTREVLRDLSLSVEPGEIVALLGPNGAGKTTAMRIALGLVPLDAGRVRADGFDAARDAREVRARTGGLIETPGFHPQHSALANLTELARLSGRTRSSARQESERALERVGLSADAGRRVDGFSQGMRQRLGIAQALLGAPRYLVLDEPQNGLDPEAVASLRALLRELAAGGEVGLLVSSHQLAELAEIATHVVVLREGRVVHRGAMRELLAGDEARIRVRTRRPEETRRVLRELALAFEERPGGELDVEAGARKPEELARMIVERDLGLVSFTPRRQTLEELYLRSVHAGPAGLSAASAPRGATTDGGAASSAPASAARAADSPEAVAPSSPRRAPPRALAAATGYELRRAWNRGRLAWLLAIPLAAGLLALLRRAAEGRADTGAVAQGEVFSATTVTAFEGVAVALGAALPLFALIVCGLASQSIAGELARGTLRNVLLRPVLRTQVVFGKALALALWLCAGYAVLAGAVVAAAGASLDFGDVSELLPNGQPFVLVSSAELWPELARVLALPLLGLLGALGIGLASGALVRSSAGALALALGALVGLDLARLFAHGGVLEPWLPSAHLPSPLSDTSVVGYFLDLARGVSSARFSFSAESIYVPLVWCALSLVVARAILLRRAVP